MSCNCNNTNNITPRIPHVYGNVLRLGIPLTLRTVELVDGEMQSTDTDFFPDEERPIKVIFSKGAVKVVLDAEMSGNIAYVEDKGKIPVGIYDIEVTCYDENGNPYRFKQKTTLQVFDATADAGIVNPIEYEVKTWYLDAAIFLALKGEDGKEGVGIEDIETESSTEIGGMNTVKIYLTNGETRTFTIMNGSGTVDPELNDYSQHPVANKTIYRAFQQVVGKAWYDSQNKVIKFYTKDTLFFNGAPTRESVPITQIDARPFIKDGMVNNAYISNNTLVITFNTDSGKEAIGVPLTSVFNPNNYYNKTQVDNLMANAVKGVRKNGTVLPKDSNGLVNLGNVISAIKINDQDPVAPDSNGLVTLTIESGSSLINAVYDSVNERVIFPAGSAVVVNERLIIQ